MLLVFFGVTCCFVFADIIIMHIIDIGK
jgi:hypothetical protein